MKSGEANGRRGKGLSVGPRVAPFAHGTIVVVAWVVK